MTLAEIKDKKLSCVIHTKSKNEAKLLEGYMPWEGYWGDNPSDRWCVYSEQTAYYIEDGILMQFSPTSFYKDKYPTYGEVYEFSDLFATGGRHKPMRLIFKNGSSIEALPQSENTVRGKNHFCTGFQAPYLDLSAFLNDGISTKNGGKNSMKFTFYTTDWTNIDKSNGEKIPMRTTYAYVGTNKDVCADTACPVAEYDERIGCLIAAAKISADKSSEAKMMYNIARNTWGTELSWAILFELADSAFNGNFERAYKKFHNDNVKFEKKRLTCSFCGKVFETVEEKRKHENEHIQHKKDKREKYLIRKEAKRRLAEAEREGKIEKVMKELYKK